MESNNDSKSTKLTTSDNNSIDKSSEILVLLLELLESVTESSEFEELLEKVGEASQKLMNVEASSLMLLDKSGEFLTLVMPTGPVKEEVKGKKIPASQGYAGWVIKNKRPFIADDVQEDSLFEGEISSRFKTQNVLCVPLFDDNKKIIGVLQAINKENSEVFDEADIPIFQTLANHTARAIQRIDSKSKLKKVLKDQDIFFREIHHRVKNDFALISGIVEIGNFDVEDEEAKKVLSDIQSRIQTMASVYDLLNSKDMTGQVKAPFYFEKLTEKISTNFFDSQSDIEIDVKVSEFTLDSYAALSCGLMINELLMNSFKHAFGTSKKGKIVIEIAKKDKLITIKYADNGKGLPDDFEIGKQNSMGFEIVQALVKQLKGTLAFESKSGTQFFIEFEEESQFEYQ